VRKARSQVVSVGRGSLLAEMLGSLDVHTARCIFILDALYPFRSYGVGVRCACGGEDRNFLKLGLGRHRNATDVDPCTKAPQHQHQTITGTTQSRAVHCTSRRACPSPPRTATLPPALTSPTRLVPALRAPQHLRNGERTWGIQLPLAGAP